MPSSVKRGWSWGADSRTPSPSESTHQAALVWKQYSSASSRGVAALAWTVSRTAAQSREREDRQDAPEAVHDAQTIA